MRARVWCPRSPIARAEAGPTFSGSVQLRDRFRPWSAWGRYHGRVSDGGSETRADGPLHVIVVDDHEVLRTGTRQILETAPDIVVVGEADDGEAALALVKELHPDVVLVDIRLPGHNGIEVARQLATSHPDTKVVILSAYDDPEYLRAALAAGVAGYLLKTMPRDELINAVRSAGLGTTVLDAAMSSHLARPSRTPTDIDVATLTTPRAAGDPAGGRRAAQQGHRSANWASAPGPSRDISTTCSPSSGWRRAPSWCVSRSPTT